MYPQIITETAVCNRAKQFEILKDKNTKEHAVTLSQVNTTHRLALQNFTQHAVGLTNTKCMITVLKYMRYLVSFSLKQVTFSLN